VPSTAEPPVRRFRQLPSRSRLYGYTYGGFSTLQVRPPSHHHRRHLILTSSSSSSPHPHLFVIIITSSSSSHHHHHLITTIPPSPSPHPTRSTPQLALDEYILFGERSGAVSFEPSFGLMPARPYRVRRLQAAADCVGAARRC
jgi:hypothetical protein